MSFVRKATLGAVAFAMVGSTVFGGAALAGDKKDGKKDGKGDVTVTNTGGAGGAGGPGQGQCLIPINLSLGALLGIGGDANAVQCSGFGGAGGAGGAGLQG